MGTKGVPNTKTNWPTDCRSQNQPQIVLSDPLSHEDRNSFSFQNVVFFSFLEYQMMDKSTIPVKRSVIHHLQYPLESTRTVYISVQHLSVVELLCPNFNSVKNVEDMIQVSRTSTATDYSSDHDIQNFHT
jgi:hypothetical protein